MSKLDEAAVRHVAHLARLSVSPEEVREYAEQLSRIIEYVEKLTEVDTAEVRPTAHPHTATDVFRQDQSRAGLTLDDALANAPDRHGDFFRVPPVLDQSDA